LNNKSIKPFKIKRNIKGLSYELDLLKKMWIHSVFHAFMLQCCNQFIPLQIICWTWWEVSSWEHSRKTDD
jgi:hypothetical protein